MIDRILRDHSFSTDAKFLEKLTLFTLIHTRTCTYQSIRYVSFLENVAYELNARLLNTTLFLNILVQYFFGIAAIIYKIY